MPKEISNSELKLWLRAMSEVKHVPSGMAATPTAKLPRIGTPRYVLSSRIDLHGYTVQQAYTIVIDQLEQAQHGGLKKLYFITGRDGAIAAEFPRWLERYASRWKVQPDANLAAWHVKRKR